MRFLFAFIFFYQCANAQFQNIFIATQPEAKGLSIAIHPKNNKLVVAGCGLAGAFYSHDAGYTWTKDSAICTAFQLQGYPLVFWDNKNNAYFSDAAWPNPEVASDGSWVDRILVNKSENQGRSFSSCEHFGKGERKTPYRHRVCVDDKNNIHVTYSLFSTFESGNQKDTSHIMYCRSQDEGHSWSVPRRINFYGGTCLNNDSSLLAPTPCIGLNGELYVVWAGPLGLMFQRSPDGGMNWPEKEKTILPFKYGWHYKINGGKANGLPVAACDMSNSPQKGRIYICWSDEKNGKNNKDVFLIFSDDQGSNWSEPVLVTYYPNHKNQFMPQMCVDQANGDLYLMYYDQRNSFDGKLTDVYLSVSRNGGLKFENYRLNEKSFRSPEKKSYGNYSGISAVNGECRPLWGQPDKNKTKVYTSIINKETIQKYNSVNNVKELELAKTFSFSDRIKINFVTRSRMKVTAVLTKPVEPGYEKILVKDKNYKAGHNVIIIESGKTGIEKGSYILTLYFNNKNTYAWIVDDEQN